MKEVIKSRIGIIVVILVSFLITILLSSKSCEDIEKTVNTELSEYKLQELQKTIDSLSKKYNNSLIIIDKLVAKNDSLVVLKSNVEIKYKHDVQFIQGATPNQLDSIIRSDWPSNNNK